MRNSVYAIAVLLALCLSAAALAGSPQNVILVMADGVRWQEVFYGVDSQLDPEQARDPIQKNIFKNLWDVLTRKHEGFILGDHLRGEDQTFYVSNPTKLSLPAYQAIMAGKNQNCKSNNCGWITEETVPERLRRELGFARRDVVSVSSWQSIEQAVEHIPGTLGVSAGVSPMPHGPFLFDPDVDELNRLQALELPPWKYARFDEFTMAQSIIYLKNYQPRFMFISFNDTDEWGHLANYPRHLAALRAVDQFFGELLATLDGMGEYGRNTTVIFTTDHGRGTGKDWKDHGPLVSASRFAWLYGRPSATLRAALQRSGRRGQQPYSHLDIRPTIERVFGLRPRQCDGCGRPILEMFQP